MVLQLQRESGHRYGAVAVVATKLGREPGDASWAGASGGDRFWAAAGTSTSDAQRVAELERENRELKRANEILKAASFFAREMDPRPRM
jgi:transposase